MGTAGAEGLGPAFIGLDVKNAGEDEAIRDEDSDAWHNDIDAHNNENYKLICEGVATGELKKGKNVTHEVIDEVVSTEGQIHEVPCMGYASREAHHIDSQQKK